MGRRTGLGVSGVVVVGLLCAGLSRTTLAQGMRSVVEPHARVFPSIGAGVTALKRDSAGRYYILAKPASVVSIYDGAGNRVGQIPNANSHGAVIRYGVDIDLGPDGNLFVADRGANTVEIFAPDGSLKAKVPVSAPTSVVALSGGQFAVTSLTSTRLVQIIDEHGRVIRSFGDPQYITEDQVASSDPEKQRIVDWGRISGDSSGGLYFAFTSLPQPTLRKYDRFGYVAYETALPENFFDSGPTTRQDRFEVGLNVTELGFSERTGEWVSFGSSGDLKFGGSVGMGLNQLFASGGNFGGAPPGAWQNNFGGVPYNLGANSTLGGTASGQISSQGAQLHFGVGSMSGPAGGGRRHGSGPADSGSVSDQSDNQGGVLQFFGTGNSVAAQDATSGDLSFNAQDLGSGGATPEDVFGALDANGNPMAPGIGFQPNVFGMPGGIQALQIFNAGGFRPGRGGPPPGGPGGSLGGANGFGGRPPGESPEGGRFADAGPGGAGSRAGFFPHRRFGAGMSEVTATARINLGDLGGGVAEKPEITAVAADPGTHETWAAIGNTLVGFSKDGSPIGIYYLTMDGGTPLTPSAVLVEPDRFLVAADPWGIFEFDRSDRVQPTDRAQAASSQVGAESQMIPSNQ